ncbi:hypothetical protein WSM22_41950 [Cytophagales bacterium WSM2-2]|nr:hypothetical protein WSM22_41950 [Cytophagales bacterium WSM2-2]
MSGVTLKSHPEDPDSELDKKKQVLLLRNLYRSFVDNTFEIIFRSSPESDRILFSNKLFIQSFGFPSYKEAKGYLLEDAFEKKEDYQRLKAKLLSENHLHQVAVHFKKLDGKRLVALVNAQTQINERGHLVFNWICLDISERVESESNLEQKNIQLTKINNQMEKFLYSTSHDLRSPITSIMGIVNLLRMETADAMVIEYTAKIESSAMKLDKIIRDIITFSKTTYKNIHTELIEFDVIVWKVINAHRSDENFNRIRIEVTIEGDSRFYSDLERMEIILDNLIRNAIQYTDTNKVRPFLNVRVISSPDHATIEVHDNGIGIARQNFSQIFNMFYKGTVQSKGAGLGLYIARESAEQLGGTISVESEVGFGSVFKVFVPNSPKGRLINRKRKLENFN